IDDENGTITAEVEKTVELSTIAPTIEVSPGAKVNPTSGTSQNFTNSVEYTVTAEDGSTTKKYTVTITHKKSDEAKIKSFKAQNASGIINEKTILVMLPFESQISSSIAPIIEVSEGAKVSPQSGVAQDFSNGKVVKYTVTSESGKVTSNYDVVVKRILPKTNISIFNEEVHFNPGEDGKGTVAIDKDKEEIKPTDITITYEDNGTKTVPHSQISIADGKDAPKWVGGKMMLKIILNLGQEYITGSMLIEVSKKA
ncbi:MAG: DUF5018-related domain-containing protein, partial [Treponema sp.]